MKKARLLIAALILSIATSACSSSITAFDDCKVDPGSNSRCD